MTLYRWRAVDEAGEVAEGEMEALDQVQVVERLRRQGRLVLRAEPVGAHLLPPGMKGMLTADLWGRRRLKDRDAALMYREMATLLRAGLPVDRALEVVGQLAARSPSGRVAADLMARVRSGATLADAMQAQAGLFPRFAIGMVRAGEAAGALEIVLHRLAEFTERSVDLKEGLTSALLYPLVLLVAAGGAVAVMLTVVLPRFRPLFEQAGVEMPLPTRIVLMAGDLAEAAWWLPLAAVAVGAVVAARRRADPAFRLAVDRRLLRVPLLGRVLAEIEAARLLRGLATLVGNGVPLLAGLTILRDSVGNAEVADAVDAAADGLRAGKGLADRLAARPWFPEVAARLVAVGEETGRLDETAARAADLLDTRARRALNRTVALLGPGMTLVLGLLVAGVVAAILLAILRVNDLAL